MILKGLGAVCSGILLASAFPPMEEPIAAWMAMVPLLLIARFSSPFASFRWGVLGGMTFWLISLSWLLRLSQTWGPLAPVVLGWVLLSCYCALYIGAFAMVVSSLFGSNAEYRMPNAEEKKKEEISSSKSSFIIRHSSFIRNFGFLVVIPILWVGLEYLRSVLFTGFPWNTLGVSQYRNLAVIQVAEWGGVYAVSAVIMIMNTALAMASLRVAAVYGGRKPSRFHLELMTGLLVCALCWMHGVRTVRRLRSDLPQGTQIRVAAIQPNIPQLKKWPVDFAAENYDRLRTQTQLAVMSGPDLIIWPETAVPGCVRMDLETAVFMKDMASLGVPILVGSMDVEAPECGMPRRRQSRQVAACFEEATRRSADPGTPNSREAGQVRASPRQGGVRVPSSDLRYYNSSFLVDTDGKIVQEYRKLHLVPFGEYLPFDKRLGFLERYAPIGMSCTPGTESTVFRLMKPENRGQRSEVRGQQGTGNREPGTEVTFSVLICFEDIMASLARKSVRNGARFLVNQTNDAWFDGSSAPLQHMSHCVFRCIENRVGAVRSTNTGVTCFIDRTGLIDRITQEILRRGETHFVKYRIESMFVPGPDMPLTFYTRYGDIPFALPCGIAAAVFFVLVVVQEKRKD